MPYSLASRPERPMRAILHAAHLGLLRRRAKALRAGEGPMAFVVLVSPATGEALLHIDPKHPPEAYRNPTAAVRRLQRDRKIGPDAYATFFANPGALVSCAGEVSADPDGAGLRFVRTVATGKATAKQVRAVLQALRMLKGRLVKPPRGGAAPQDAPADPPGDPGRTDAVTDWFGDTPPPAQEVVAGVFAKLGGVDGLLSGIDALADATDPEAIAARTALETARDALDRWDDAEGIAGVQAGFASLLSMAGGV